MNKKFSTLVAAFLVAGGMTSAFALGNPTRVKSIEAGKAYQLASGAKVLVMEKATDGTYKASFVDASTVTNLASSLWTISYTGNVVGGPDFKLVNKLTGCPLSVDLSALTVTATEVGMGGNVSEWKWLAASKSDADLHTSKLYSYFKTDSVVYLAYDTSTGALKAAKESATKYVTFANLSIAPATAAAYTLTAKDLNTKLGLDPEGKSFNLSANPELKIGENSTLGNIFTANTFRAWNTANNSKVDYDNFEVYAEMSATPNFASTAKDEGYVLLQAIDGKNDDKVFDDTYLTVDTAYIEGTSRNLKLVGFTTDALSKNVYGGNTYLAGPAKNRSLESSMFKFVYYPTQDSLAIFVKSYNDKATTATNGSYWTQKNTANTLITANKLTNTTELTVLATAGPANIKFTLGEGTTNRTSVANNVYVIRNNKGQYLAVPIYESTGATPFAAAKWVTLSEQEALRMPAYQWVVLKNNKETEEFAKVSTVDVINREFVDVANDKVQLRQEVGGSYLFVAGNTLGSDSLTFEAVDPEILKDKYLGYMNIDAQNLDVMNYNLNYLNPYVSDKYIGLNENDSILTVKDANTAFYLEKGANEVEYGFDPKDADIEGLAQLVRYTYAPYIKTAEGVQYIGLDDESQYYVAPSAKTAKKFYFKENNYYQPEGVDAARPYYALVDLTETPYTKAGTSDNDMSATLKNQVMDETRTSAFAVVPNDAPLYRRFNSVALDGAVEGSEDAAKVLKFKEFYRGEYLMDEANENFKNEGVNYLGIDRADKAVAGLSFNVDTAILTATPSGTIKPQYFVYVSKEEVASVPGTPCNEDGNHVDANGEPTDAAHCVHATPAKPGFTVAKYLVSFADSTDTKLYKFGEYTRVGFVKGLHIGDSLYILTNGFEKMAAADLDTATIIANYKATKNTQNIIDLKANRNDKHHKYTWSFRYINPEAAAAEEESARSFLFESEALNVKDSIAPTNAAWLKSQNGCLVLSDPNTSTFENAKTGGDNALVFNVEVGSEDDMATSNETIAAGNVVVAGTNGAVVVKGAEGKSVIVSTILGKVVANEVLTSDNAQITAPAGVVVVSVDGESFKVVVK